MPPSSAPADSDLVFIHGINDFGGKFAMHADKFLDAGVRPSFSSALASRAIADAPPYLAVSSHRS